MQPPNKTNPASPLTTLITASSITFIARTWFAMFDDDDQPQPGLMPGQAFAVRARRPGCLRIEEVHADPVVQAAIRRAGCCSGTPFGVFVCDGIRQCELCITSRLHIEGEAAPALAHIQSQRGLPKWIGVDVLFADNPLDGFAPRGEEILEGVPVIVYVQKLFQHEELRHRRLYLAKETGWPVRLSVFQPGTPGTSETEVEMRRTNFTDWEWNVPLPDSTFNATPPPGMEPEPPAPPWFDPGLQEKMEPAPLETTDIAGNPISLQEYAGKVILLDYWATWCSPCRKEMLALKRLYEQLHPQGLDVIGISLDDEGSRQQMLDFLQEKDIPWRQVCDGKGFKSGLATAYQVGAIPFTLLIGRDGRIAAVNAHEEELEDVIRRALKA
jgi:peroxiredoxin